MPHAFDGSGDRHSPLGDWFSRHRRTLALAGVAGVLASAGIVAAFLASQPLDAPRTPFAGAELRTDVPAGAAALPQPTTAVATSSPTTSPDPTVATSPPTSTPATSSPTSSATSSATSSPPQVQPTLVTPTQEPFRPAPSPSSPAPTEPSKTPTTPPQTQGHSLVVEVTGGRTFVAVTERNGDPLFAKRMRPGKRFSIDGQEYLRLFVERRSEVRIIIDGVERPMEGDPQGRFGLIIG